MQWVQDSYVFVAGDAAAAFAGRAYNAITGRFENTPGTPLAPFGGSPLKKPHKVRVVTLRIFHTGGAVAAGTRVGCFTVADPLNTGLSVDQGAQINAPFHVCTWHLYSEMVAGVQFRINLGGIVAGDTVSWAVGYE